jgi:hypothetical protein
VLDNANAVRKAKTQASEPCGTQNSIIVSVNIYTAQPLPISSIPKNHTQLKRLKIFAFVA